MQVSWFESSSSINFFPPQFLSTRPSTLYYIYPKGGGWGTDDGDKYGYGVIKGGAVKAVSFAEANNVSRFHPMLRTSPFRLSNGAS